MYTKLFKLKLCRFQVCGMSPREVFAQSILIARRILIWGYNCVLLENVVMDQLIIV